MFKLLVLGLFLAFNSGAVELADATNEEILNELNARLSKADPASASRAHYVSTSHSDFKVEIFDGFGDKLTEHLLSFGTKSTTYLQPQLRILNESSTRFVNAELYFAVCSNKRFESWTVYFYQLEGTKLNQVRKTQFNGSTECLSRAEKFNRS